MAKVLVWREVGMMRPNNVWERSRVRESGSDSPPRESRLIAQENHRPRGGALERRNKPLQGVYISSTKKIAPDTHNTATSKVVTDVAFARENRPQLTKTLVIQKIITNSSGRSIVALLCSIISHRSCARFLSRARASDCIIRCSSSFGARARSCS